MINKENLHSLDFSRGEDYGLFLLKTKLLLMKSICCFNDLNRTLFIHKISSEMYSMGCHSGRVTFLSLRNFKNFSSFIHFMIFMISLMLHCCLISAGSLAKCTFFLSCDSDRLKNTVLKHYLIEATEEIYIHYC